MDEFTTSVRDVERRIQRAEEHNNETPIPIARPASIPDSFEEHAKLMYDLFVLAYQADLTRVVTFMTCHEFSGQTYPEAGVPDAHHGDTGGTPQIAEHLADELMEPGFIHHCVLSAARSSIVMSCAGRTRAGKHVHRSGTRKRD